MEMKLDLKKSLILGCSYRCFIVLNRQINCSRLHCRDESSLNTTSGIYLNSTSELNLGTYLMCVMVPKSPSCTVWKLVCGNFINCTFVFAKMHHWSKISTEMALKQVQLCYLKLWPYSVWKATFKTFIISAHIVTTWLAGSRPLNQRLHLRLAQWLKQV